IRARGVGCAGTSNHALSLEVVVLLRLHLDEVPRLEVVRERNVESAVLLGRPLPERERVLGITYRDLRESDRWRLGTEDEAAGPRNHFLVHRPAADAQ